jgi:hypothetical protein
MTRSTLAKLRTLEKLCEAGYADEVLERSLEKLLAHQQTQLQMHLQALEKDLQEFEARYSMSSADFLARYRTGELGDSADVMEWQALYRMQAQLRQHLMLLQESNGGADHHDVSGPGKSQADQ